MRKYNYMNQEDIPVENQYFTYLVRHNQDVFTAKDYSSRVNSILENLDDEFVIRKKYNDIPGSRNFLSFDGRYIINKKNIEYVKKDISDYYILNKRLTYFKYANVEEIVSEIEEFLEFILNNKLFRVDEINIEKYCYALDRDRKDVFIKSIKSYSDLKGLELDFNLLDKISKENEEVIEILEKAKIMAQNIKKYPWIKEEVLNIINIYM